MGGGKVAERVDSWLGACWPSFLAKTVRDPTSKTKVQSNKGKTSDSHPLTYMYALTCIHFTHTYKNKYDYQNLY